MKWIRGRAEAVSGESVGTTGLRVEAKDWRLQFTGRKYWKKKDRENPHLKGKRISKENHSDLCNPEILDTLKVRK